MSLAKTIAALEEFTEEVTSEIVADQPTDGDFSEETAGVDFQEESGAIDEDVVSITEAAQGLEDIISLVEEAPGEADQPLQPFVEKAVNVALESNDFVQEAGNPVEGSEDKTKAGVLEAIKKFAKHVWEMLVKFGQSIAQWIREVWAKYTDRIVRNANRAEKLIAISKQINAGADAKITDKSLLAKIASAGGLEVGEVIQNVDAWMNIQGGKDASGKSKELTKEARECVRAVSSGQEVKSSVMERFTKALAEAAGDYQEKATAEQAKASGAAEGTQVHMSKEFFGGYRAWIAVPDDETQLTKWNHGITKVEEAKVLDSVSAPDPQEITAICKFLIEMGTLVKFYEHYLKDLDALNKELDQAAKKAGRAGENNDEAKAELKVMQAVIPRIIKGPQVAAYAYSANASTVALQYCEAGVRAHRGEKTVGEHASALGAKAGKAANTAKDAAGAFANGAKDKVKSTFGGKQAE